MDEQMIASLARVIEQQFAVDPICGGRFAACTAEAAARAAHSLIAGKVAELEGALAEAQEQVGAYGYRTVHGRRVRQSWAAELLAKISAALAPYPERRSEP